ncbi:UNVERIFIED_CONTAM: hypothetical protein K2H54_049007 [Gekko kuhli]
MARNKLASEGRQIPSPAVGGWNVAPVKTMPGFSGHRMLVTVTGEGLHSQGSVVFMETSPRVVTCTGVVCLSLGSSSSLLPHSIVVLLCASQSFSTFPEIFPKHTLV